MSWYAGSSPSSMPSANASTLLSNSARRAAIIFPARLPQSRTSGGWLSRTLPQCRGSHRTAHPAHHVKGTRQSDVQAFLARCRCCRRSLPSESACTLHGLATEHKLPSLVLGFEVRDALVFYFELFDFFFTEHDDETPFLVRDIPARPLQANAGTGRGRHLTEIVCAYCDTPTSGVARSSRPLNRILSGDISNLRTSGSGPCDCDTSRPSIVQPLMTS